MFAEDLFLINTIIDFCLLLCVKKILKKKESFWQLLIGSITGSFFTIIIYYYDFFLLNFVVMIIICLISFGFASFLEFIKTIVCLFLVSFSLAGAISFVLSFLRITEFPYVLFFMTIILCFTILTYITKVYKIEQKQEIEEIEIKLFDKTKKIKALRDTGNLTGAIVAEYSAIKELLPEEFCENYEKDDEYYSLIGKYKFDILPMRTISSTELLLALPMGTEKIAIARKKLSNNNKFQAII